MGKRKDLVQLSIFLICAWVMVAFLVSQTTIVNDTPYKDAVPEPKTRRTHERQHYSQSASSVARDARPESASSDSMCLRYNECSGHGVCLDGSCKCLAEWKGSNCSIVRCADKNGCHGHGRCDEHDHCICDDGWLGEDCSENRYANTRYYMHQRATASKQVLDLPTPPKETRKIEEAVSGIEFHAVFVYPYAVYWEPVARPQQILTELGTRGYLCFFVVPSDAYPKFTVEQKVKNVFLVNEEKYLLRYLAKLKQPVVTLITHVPQLAFSTTLKEAKDNVAIWYDIIDDIKIFYGYDRNVQKVHNELVESTADLVTYSAHEIRRVYVSPYQIDKTRREALYIPNGVNMHRNWHASGRIPRDMQKIVDTANPIIGFFGSIEPWIDFDVMRWIAKRNPDWSFVWIGKVSDSVSGDMLHGNTSNVHILGPKNWEVLVDYASLLDVGLIPFKVTSLTNAVSPVKFFEYAALGLPIVATNFGELLQYKDIPWVFVSEPGPALENSIEQAMERRIHSLARKQGPAFAHANSWQVRVDAIINGLKERSLL